jgi:hypothetical protein
LPVAPDFQDPAKAPNYQPAFTFFDPQQETEVSQLPQDFLIRLADPNPLDTLYVRWATDYPPYVQSRSRVVIDTKITSTATKQSVFPLVSCENLKMGVAHRLVVIVSDRPFVPDATGVYRFNEVEGNSMPIMAGWSIPGCP